METGRVAAAVPTQVPSVPAQLGFRLGERARTEWQEAQRSLALQLL